MGYECFELTQDAGVAHLRMNRPERRNAMTVAFWRELPEIVRGLEARALVLSSTGAHFTAGMDLSVFAQSTLGTATVAERKVFRAKLEELQQTFHALAEAPFPVIAAVQGGCIGGGVDMVTACCLRYATRDAWFVIQEINLGMMADVGTFNRAPNQLPDVGTIEPNAFEPVAEDAGLILPLGAWVIQEACRTSVPKSTTKDQQVMKTVRSCSSAGLAGPCAREVAPPWSGMLLSGNALICGEGH